MTSPDFNRKLTRELQAGSSQRARSLSREMSPSDWKDGAIPFSELIQNMLAGDGTLSGAGFAAFWDKMSTPAFATVYLVGLMAKLSAIVSGDDRTTPLATMFRQICTGDLAPQTVRKVSDGDRKDPSYMVKQAVVNTLYFIGLFYQFDPSHAAFRRALNSWQSGSGDQPGRTGFNQEVYRLLSADYLTQTDAIVTFVETCTNIECFRGQLPLPERADALTGRSLASSMIYPYLRRCLQRNQKVTLIFETINLFIKHPLITTSRLQSLMHMLRHFLTVHPGVDPTLLETTLTLVKPYLLWQLPYGAVAHDLIQFINNELKFPGTGLARLFLDENPGLPLDAKLSKSSSDRCKTVHVLVNRNSASGRSFQEILNSSSVEENPEVTSKTALLSHLLEANLRKDPDELKLWMYGADQIGNYYSEALGCMKACLECKDYKQAQELRVPRMKALWDKIRAAHPAHPGTAKPVYYTRTPTHKFEYHQLITERLDTVDHVPTLSLPHVATMNLLEGILKPYSSEATAPESRIVRIAVAGGDGTLHNVVCGFLALKQCSPELFVNVDLRFYILPLGQCNYLASFLATYDGWYHRHVLSGMQANLKIYPTLSGFNRDRGVAKKLGIDAGGRDESFYVDDYFDTSKIPARQVSRLPNVEPALVTPGSFLRETIDMYVREARNVLPVNIYQCECWAAAADSATKNTFRTLPFCQRLEIGNTVFQHKNNMMQQQKATKFVPIELSMKYTMMNCAGMARTAPAMEAKPVQSLIISNVPRVADKGTPANPTVPWLEMHMVEGEGGKKKKKISNTNGETFHIGYVEIKSEDRKKPFDVIIDGELFGSFYKIRVSACKAKDSSEIISLPIMNHLALEF